MIYSEAFLKIPTESQHVKVVKEEVWVKDRTRSDTAWLSVGSSSSITREARGGGTGGRVQSAILGDQLGADLIIVLLRIYRGQYKYVK